MGTLYPMLHVSKWQGEANWRSMPLEGRLSYAFEYELFSDVVIKVKRETFFAHKCILALHSPVFKKIFYDEGASVWWAVLDELRPRGFQLMLRFIYYLEVSKKFTTPETLVHAYDTAKKLHMLIVGDKIMQAILNYFEIPNIKQQDFCEFLKLSLELKLPEVSTELLKLLLRNTYQSTRNEKIWKTENETLKLTFCLKRMNVSQSKITKCISLWKNHDINWNSVLQPLYDNSKWSKFSRNKYIQKLLKKIQSGSLSAKAFYDIVSKKEDLVFGKDALSILMHLIDSTENALPAWISPESLTSNSSTAIFTKNKPEEAPERKKFSMLEDGNMPDVCIFVGSQKVPFYSHRLILALGSEYFAIEFYSNRKRVINLPKEDPEIFGVFLRFFCGSYTEIFKSISLPMMFRIYDLTIKYSFEDLNEKCLSVFKSTLLTPKIFWTLLHDTENSRNIVVKRKTLKKYAQKNMEYLLRHDSFVTACETCLIFLLRQNESNVLEYDLLENVAKWLNQNCKEFSIYESGQKVIKYEKFDNASAEKFYSALKMYNNVLVEDNAFMFSDNLCNNLSQIHSSVRDFSNIPNRRSIKLCTKIEIYFKSNAKKNWKSYKTSYKVRRLNCTRDCEIQYLELFWRTVAKKKKAKVSKTIYNILIHLKDKKKSIYVTDITVAEFVRIKIPVHFTLNAHSSEEEILISITMDAARKVQFLNPSKFCFNDILIETLTSNCCVSAVIVDEGSSQ